MIQDYTLLNTVLELERLGVDMNCPDDVYSLIVEWTIIEVISCIVGGNYAIGVCSVQRSSHNSRIPQEVPPPRRLVSGFAFVAFEWELARGFFPETTI